MNAMPEGNEGIAHITASETPLTVPLLVRGSFVNGAVILLTSAACTLAFCSILVLLAELSVGKARVPSGIVAVLILLPAAFGLPGLFLALRLLVQRRWLEVTLTGFVLSSRGRKTAFLDEQIVAVTRRIGRDPFLESPARYMRLEVDHDGILDRLDCSYRYLPGKLDRFAAFREFMIPGLARKIHGKVDPFRAFLDRVSRGLARRTREGFARGAALSGREWRVDAGGIHCILGGKWAKYPFAVLTRASCHAGYLCVWKAHEDWPFLRVPVGSRNADPLRILLQEYIAANPAAKQPLPGKPLGRILLDHHGGDRRDGLIVSASSLILFLMLLSVSVLSRWPAPGLGLLFFAGLPLPILVAGIVEIVRSGRSTIRFHEFGVSQLTRDGVRELLYTEIGTMSWKDNKEIVFIPSSSLNRPTIHYRSTHVRNNADLIGFRVYIARKPRSPNETAPASSPAPQHAPKPAEKDERIALPDPRRGAVTSENPDVQAMSSDEGD